MLKTASLVLLLIVAGSGQADVRLTGQVERLQGHGWEIEGLQWSLTQTEAGTALHLNASRVFSDAEPPQLLTDVVVDCRSATVTHRDVACRKGLLRARWAGQNLSGPLDLDWNDGSLSVAFSTPLAGGTIALRYTSDAQASGTFRLDSVVLVQLLDLLPWSMPDGYSLGPTTRINLDGQWLSEQGVDAQLKVSELSFDSSAGTVAGADLELAGRFKLGANSAISLELGLEAGELLLDPLYLSFGEQPTLSLAASGQLGSDGAVALKSVTVTDNESIRLVGRLNLNAAGELVELDADIEQLSLPLGYQRYLAPVVESLGAAGLQPSGQILGRVQWLDGALNHLTLSLDEFGLSDERDRYGARDVSGLIDYDAAGNSLDSSLSWSRLRYYSLVVGAAQSRFFAGGGQFGLLSPVFLPILDGGVQVHELAMGDVGSDAMTLDFRGDIKPMSLAQVTNGLGWTEMEGSLSGEIPAVKLRNQVVEVGGVVEIDVFDGAVVISNLRLERIFGVLPTLAADIMLDDIDLEQLTGAFSFGRIEGRLDGRVAGLRMLNWRPVAFDLALYTAPNSKSRRKISQRAVDNLSSIGGGYAALSQTILRFFEDFSYRRLGISCRLVNDTCFMGGVGAAGNGYYLVEGSGIPRIDVKGFARQVDWPQLVNRLQAATRSGGATVQ